MRSFVAALLALLLADCAGKGAVVRTTTEMARAERFVLAGCYRCLQDALAIYERQILAARKPSPALLQAAFDTSVLVLLREKELGIPFDDSLTRARASAARVVSPPGSVPAATIVELADLSGEESSGSDPDASAARAAPARRMRLAGLRPALSNAGVSLVATYLIIALDCDDREARPRLTPALLEPYGNPALLQYRLAVCGVVNSTAWTRVRDTDPRWAEIAFFEGRAHARARQPNLRGAVDSFTAAYEAFPESPAILLALAQAQRGYGDLEPALASYDGVIARVPTNRNALLGRVITLSFLDRTADAIATATGMIDLGTWLMGDAYYWRARNRYIEKSLEEAWSDIENAVKLAANTNVFTLAGVIAYDRKDLDTAKARFQSARDMDFGNCTAHSYYALVLAAQNHWPEATPIFSIAMGCFIGASAEAARLLEAIEAADYDPVLKGRLKAEQQKAISEADLKAAQSAYNGAQGLLRDGKRSEALTHLQLALQHPEMKEHAEALQKLIAR